MITTLSTSGICRSRGATLLVARMRTKMRPEHLPQRFFLRSKRHFRGSDSVNGVSFENFFVIHACRKGSKLFHCMVLRICLSWLMLRTPKTNKSSCTAGNCRFALSQNAEHWSGNRRPICVFVQAGKNYLAFRNPWLLTLDNRKFETLNQGNLLA